MNSHLTTLNEANVNYKLAIGLLSTSCFKCKFTPCYIEAIPLLKTSADAYHILSKYEDELNVRRRLIEAFRYDKNYYDEGNEYEQLILLYLKCFNNINDAYIMVCNAYNAYVNGGCYERCVNMLVKRADDFMEMKYVDYSEKILKKVFHCVLMYFHSMCNKVNECNEHTYVYNGIIKYVEVLVYMERYEECVEVLQQVLKIVFNEEDEERNEVVNVYGMYLSCLLIVRKYDEFENEVDKVKEYTNRFNVDDKGIIDCVWKIYIEIRNGSSVNEKRLYSFIKNYCELFPDNLSKRMKLFCERSCNKSMSNNSDIALSKDELN